jgi:hypothetical protein
MAEKQIELNLEPEKAVETVETTEVTTARNTDLSVNPYTDKEAFNNLFTMAKQLASSDIVPSNYQGKTTNCMIALDTANRMGLSPLFVMQQMSIIKGKCSWSGQACSSLVNNYPKFKDVELVYVGKEGTDDWGAYVQAVRKDNGKTIKGTTVTMKMVKGEGWDSNSKWRTMPEQMLAYRAYAFFARVHCADSLNGFMVEGEYEDAFGEHKEAPSFD